MCCLHLAFAVLTCPTTHPHPPVVPVLCELLPVKSITKWSLKQNKKNGSSTSHHVLFADTCAFHVLIDKKKSYKRLFCGTSTNPRSDGFKVQEITQKNLKSASWHEVPALHKSLLPCLLYKGQRWLELFWHWVALNNSPKELQKMRIIFSLFIRLESFLEAGQQGSLTALIQRPLASLTPISPIVLLLSSL